MEARFGVSRKTAERMRDAVEMAFGPLELADSDDNRNHWRLRSNAVRRLVPLSAEELAELEAAAGTLERTGFEARAAALRELDTKLRATQHTGTLERIESDIEALVQAEGLAMRPGPRQQLDRGLLACLREAITTCRIVELRYLSQSTGRHSSQRIEPYGLLYGNRAFLVGRTDWRRSEHAAMAARKHERGPRDRRELHPRPRLRPGVLRAALLRHLPGGAGGTWCCASAPEAKRDASAFLFHPQPDDVQENADGTLTVRFTAGGLDEMCWHLVTWGESVRVERPARLRQRSSGDMHGLLAEHHRELN